MRRIVLIINILALTLCIGSCAKQGMPSGGPKDVTPPKTRATQPENKTLGFAEKSFYVEFDEYVVLKDADNNILVSPPMKNKPEYKTKGHGIQVKINDTLQPNTTYLFQFKNAIADLNEGNLLPSFEYVFSTGDVIDSLSLHGRVLDAQQQIPRKETVTVMLYDASKKNQLQIVSDSDSVTSPEPLYVTRCDSTGRFKFNYIRDGVYYVVAVEDGDKNLQVGKSEAVAFSNSHYTATPMNATDSTGKSDIALNIFEPDVSVQRVTGSGFVKQGMITVSTLKPMQQPVVDAGTEKTFCHLNNGRDTLTIWTLNEKCDSLRFVVSDPSGLQDTLKLRLPTRKKGQVVQSDSKSADISLNYKQLPYFDTLRIVSKIPLDTAKCLTDSVVSILQLKDSSLARCGVTLDSSLMAMALPYPFKQGEKYLIRVEKDVFHDIYGNANDSLQSEVSVTSAEQYGKIIINVQSDSLMAETPLIVELLDGKGNVKATEKCNGNAKITFKNLLPDKYRVRVIADENNNGKWDTGDYSKGRQPERVIYMKKTIDLRANWDFEEKMIIE